MRAAPGESEQNVLGLKLEQNWGLSTPCVCVRVKCPPQAAPGTCWRSGLAPLSSGWGLRQSSGISVLYSCFTQWRKSCLAARAEELRVWALLRRWSLCQPRTPNHPNLGAPFPPPGVRTHQGDPADLAGMDGDISSLIPRAFCALQGPAILAEVLCARPCCCGAQGGGPSRL